MDLPLRTRLLVVVLAVAFIGGALTVIAGSLLINDMVIGEAQRRVALALKTSRAMLDRRLEESRKDCGMVAAWVARGAAETVGGMSDEFLEHLRGRLGYDSLHIADQRGIVTATAPGNGKGADLSSSPVVSTALRTGKASAGLRLVPLSELAAESPALAERAYIRVVETPRAKPGGPSELTEAMVVEAAAPVVGASGEIVGVVRARSLLNRDFGLVDFIRDNIFTVATYKGKNLGTVTIFERDVRIATNVIGPDGARAIGTRVSAEVNDKVLGEGGVWIGPAFVVDSWYMSAYEPIRDTAGRIIGILYVGVLKDRYDDMRVQAVGIFLAIAVLALVLAAVAGDLLARRLARRIRGLTEAAVQIAQGNLDYRLPEPPRAEHDEIKRLTVAFNAMVAALKERDEALRRSHEELERVAEELERWNQNYLDTLGFITHELKNQVASMKINLLALRDGYIGELTQDQREALDDVMMAVNRTEDMILNYLNLSRIEKGELEVRARPVQVELDVVQPVLRDTRPRFEEKHMRVEVDIPEDLVICADPSLLQIVYENLLSNAAKYGREGGLVRVWGRRLNGVVELHVWNEGNGIPEDQLQDLFRKFSRLNQPMERERGTGLGLFITREIVRKHGGSIRAESEHGKWIDFIFSLPRHDALVEEPLVDSAPGHC